jgi:hypothetical protein
MNMMKNLYQEGDDDMKRTIAEAWVIFLIFIILIIRLNLKMEKHLKFDFVFLYT